MMAPESRANPDVATWLGGLEPAWAMLDRASLVGLMDEPSAENRTLRLANDLTGDELTLSPVARNALVLLRGTVEGGGLNMTAAGNLSRATVSAMEEAMTWPDHDPADARRCRKVLNEADYRHLHFTRALAELAGLVEHDRGRLQATRLGRDMLGGNSRALQAVLFHLAFWRLDLAPFGRGLLDRWPQQQIGSVLWALSVSADDWQPPDILVRLCAIPSDAVLERAWDIGSLILEARILRPLYWFGLLEYRSEDEATSAGTGMPHAWRKSVLFDRFLDFEVQLRDAGSVRH